MRLIGAVALVLSLLLGASGLVGLRLYRMPGPLLDARDVVVPRGRLETVGQALASAGIIRHAMFFQAVGLVSFSDGPIRAGELRFPAHASLAAIFDVLRHGPMVQHRVTIPEGLESAQIARVLAQEGPLLTGELVIGDEGSLLPQTYGFERGVSFASVARRARLAMERALADAWRGRDPNLPLRSASEAVILASIVEHEAKLPAERAVIARVFLNRLASGMRLQADPTAAYGASGGLGVLRRKLDRTDLERDDPYNTYVLPGLPAGPICSPGLASLLAVLHPARGDARYFVADGTGGHVFAATLSEHMVNVEHYRARLEQSRRKDAVRSDR